MGFKNVVTLTLACLFGIAFLGVSDALDYGDVCTGDEECNATVYLSCHVLNATADPNGACGCKVPFIRDHEADQCVVPVGIPDATCIEHVNNGTFPTPCTPHSFCVQLDPSKVGYCQCLPSFIATPIGQCKLSHGFGVCEKHTDCNINAFLTCGVNNTCVCDQELARWDGQKCVGLVGGSCQAVEDPVNPATRTCVINSECDLTNPTNGTCKCSPNYDETEDHQCLKTHSQPCDQNSDCNPIFECRDMSCQCSSTTNYENGQCKSLAGRQCSITDTNDQCTIHSTCQENAQNITVCECSAGYSATKTGLCRVDHQGPCTIENDDCNSDKHLICMDSICTCEGTSEFLNGICVADVGGSCNLEDNNCISHSICTDNNSTTTCTCPPPSSPSSNNKECYLDYSHACDSTGIQCNPNNFLTCMADASSTKCSCDNPDQYIYQNPLGCVGKVESVCGVDQGRNRGCVANAACGTDQICACLPNFLPTDEKLCVASVEAGAGSLQASLAFTTLIGILMKISNIL